MGGCGTDLGRISKSALPMTTATAYATVLFAMRRSPMLMIMLVLWTASVVALSTTPLRTANVVALSTPLRAGGATMSAPASAEAEAALLQLVDSGASRKAVLEAFEALEAAAPAPSDLLLKQEGVDLIKGRWSLLGTIAAAVGDDDIADTGVSSAVNASGLVVDASSERKPLQEIDVREKRIANEIQFTLPLVQRSAIVRVAGGFAPDVDNGRRAYAEFDTLDLFLQSGDDGAEGVRRVLRAGWLFSLIRALKPALVNGREGETSWLETTYITERVRLGRGNKGSVFILSRSEENEGGGPLAEWPL